MGMSRGGRFVALVLLFGLIAPWLFSDAWAIDENEPPSGWKEAEVSLPKSSLPTRLVGLDLGPAEQNRFEIDRDTLAVASDGVVRFLVVVTSSGGARTVSYEGIRCATKERRTYGFGRPDGTWSPARIDHWTPIDARGINAYAAMLYRDFFCPGGIAVYSSKEAVAALEHGQHASYDIRP